MPRRGVDGGVQAGDLRPLVSLCDQFLRDFCETLRATLAPVLQPELEAALGTQARDGGGLDGQGDAFLDCLQSRCGIRDDIGDGHARVLALPEVLQGDKHRAGVGFELAVDQAVAGQRRVILHGRVLGKDLRDILGHGLAAIKAGTVGQDDGRKQVALIFRWHETAGDGAEQRVDAKHHGAKCDHGQRDALHGQADTTRIAVGGAFQPGVEPLEKAAGFTLRGLDKDGRQCRGQGQCHETGDGDRDGNGDGELLVEHAGGAGHEGHGYEHRDQHQGGGDHRSGDFLHGLEGGIFRRQA